MGQINLEKLKHCSDCYLKEILFLILKIKTITKDQCQSYIGCYADVYNSINRDLSGTGLNAVNYKGGGSINSCIAYCSSMNFLYAGNQNG